MTRSFRLRCGAVSILLIGFFAALASSAQGATATAGATASAKPASTATHSLTRGNPGTIVVTVAHVPASSLTAAQRKRLQRPGMTATLGVYTIYEFSIYPVNGTHKCLDASTSSPYENEPGDPLQLYSCYNDYKNHANQWWNPINTDGDYVELENWEYQGLCLEGISYSTVAELSYCYSGDYYELWDWYYFRKTVGNSGSGNYAQLVWGENTSYSLAAYDNDGYSPGQNSDPVTVYPTHSGVGYEEFTY
jgi:hypothetical protein